MGQDRTPDDIRGFIVPLQQFSSANVWTAQSTFTQGTSRPGVATSDSDPSLQVITGGLLTSAIDIETNRAGHVTDAAGFVWKHATDTDYLGFDVPTTITNTEVIESGSATTAYTTRDAIRLNTGALVAVSEQVGPTVNTSVVISIVDIDGATTKVTIDSVSSSLLGGQKKHPCMCLLPDDSIICAYWVNNNVDNTANIEVQRSVDDGKTWSLISARAIDTDIDTSGSFGGGTAGYDLDRLTIAANNSQVLLFAGLLVHDTSKANGNVTYQYASTSAGTRFNYIDGTSETTGDKFYMPNVVTYNNAFLLSYARSNDSIGFTRLSNATESVMTRVGVVAANTLTCDFPISTVVSNRLTDTSLTMWIDTDSRVYIAYSQTSQHRKIHGAFTDLAGKSLEEYGKTWIEWGTKSSSDPRLFDADPPGASNGDGGLINLSGVSGAGNQVLFCQFDSDGTNNYKNSIFQLCFGGYAAVNFPALINYPQDQNRGYFTYDYLPIDTPDQGSVWTKATAGAATATLTTLLRLASSGSGDSILYSRGINDKTNGLMLHLKVSSINGTSTSSGTQIIVSMQETTSTDTVKVKIVIAKTAVYIYDVHNSLSLIGSATGLNAVARDLYIFIDNSTNKIQLHHADSGNVRKYSTIEASLTTNAAHTTQSIEWGIVSSIIYSFQSDWHYFKISEGSDIGLKPSQDLNSKRYSAIGYYTQITEGLRISTSNGPARIGDQYSISPVYDSPIDNVLYTTNRSRQVTYRSTAITTDPDANNTNQEIIAFAIDHTLLGVECKLLSDSYGLHLSNINFLDFTVEKYQSGAWSTAVTVENYLGNSFSFTRTGNTIVCTGPGPSTFIHYAECQGYKIKLDDGAGNVLVRTIKTNSEGVINNSTTTKRCVFQLEDHKNTDPTSGTAKIIPSEVTVLIHNLGDIAGLRLNIPAQRTKEGYIQIGTMVLGSLVIPATQYSRGRTINLEVDITEETDRSGIIRSAVTGIGGRTARIAWSEGIDISQLYDATAAPDYYKVYSSGEPIAAIGSAPTTMLGLLKYVQGSNNAIVYLPTIPTGSATSAVINRYHDHICCTMGSDIQIENVLGSESKGDLGGEVLRVSTVILREIR